jgi:hypothetical protein
MLPSILLLAAVTQSPQCAGAGTACCNTNCGAAAKQSADAKASYLVKVIDPKQEIAKALEPCVSIEQIVGADGKQVAVAVDGVQYTVTLKLADGVSGVALTKAGGVALAAGAKPNSYIYTPTEEGQASLEATVKAKARHTLKCASKVRLAVPAIDAKCAGMKFKTASGGGGGPAGLDAATIVGLLGAPAPLTLKAQPQQQGLYVYSSSDKAEVNNAAVAGLIKAIHLLPASAARTSSGLALEMDVPSDAAKDALTGAGSTKFKVSMADAGKVEITEGQGAASCEEWLAELEAVEQRALPGVREPHMSQLFYLASASDTADALTKTITMKSGTASTTATKTSAGAAASRSGADAGAKTGTPSGAAPDQSGNSSSVVDSSATAAGGSAPVADKSSQKTAPPSTAADQAQTSGMNQGSSQASGQESMGSTGGSAAAQGFTVQGLQKDLLVFGGDDDAPIRQAKQVLAMLDLPRPEMIINTWILQASTSRADEIGRFSETARRLVAENNEVLQRGIEAGWASLAASANQPNFFDESFYRYLVYRYIGAPGEGGPVDDVGRESMGICPQGEYCLGYTTLFSPLRPRLTDLLLAMIAARRDRQSEVEAAIDAAERPSQPMTHSCETAACVELRRRLGIDEKACGGWSCTKPSQKAPKGSQTLVTERSGCGLQDLQKLIDSAGDRLMQDGRPSLQLECFRGKIQEMFQNKGAGQSLARGAIADFLYQYKLSQQYPREFSPYNLTLSADTLNTALAPFIDAFNRDIRAFQDYLNNVVRMKVDCQPCGNVTFTDTGLVSVRTVSVNPTEVSSTSQSSLDAGNFPDVATVAANLLGGGGSSGKDSSGKGSSSAAGLLPPNEATLILGALKSFQTTQAQIGRQIDVKVTPRSLSGASAAEMDVTLKVDDAGKPSAFTGTSSQPLNLSRVATHDTTTHVRVDSLKLFEVSGVGAELTLSRPPIPLIPPLVELPYIGSLVGIPRKPSEEFHSSVAIMSAIVVPTAADLAYGITFVDDRIIMAPPGSCRMPWIEKSAANPLAACITLTTASQQELEAPIHAFHRVKRQCLLTGGRIGYSSLTPSNNDPCSKLKFDTLIPET